MSILFTKLSLFSKKFKYAPKKCQHHHTNYSYFLIVRDNFFSYTKSRVDLYKTDHRSGGTNVIVPKKIF